MIKYNLGISTDYVYKIKYIDSDYFEESSLSNTKSLMLRARENGTITVKVLAFPGLYSSRHNRYRGNEKNRWH